MEDRKLRDAYAGGDGDGDRDGDRDRGFGTFSYRRLEYFRHPIELRLNLRFPSRY